MLVHNPEELAGRVNAYIDLEQSKGPGGMHNT